MVIMSTVLNVKIDEKLKRDAKAVAKAVGLPMSIVVSASLREFVRTRSLTISDIPQLRTDVVDELLKIEKDPKKRTDLSPAFKNIDDAVAWLDS